MTGYLVVAALLNALAGWADDALAGGAPPKHVAQELIIMMRYVAGLARLADTGYDLDTDPDGYVPH
jgi:hypothetical protein